MIVAVPLPPRAIVTLPGVAVTVKFPSGLTVRVIVVVAVTLPEVPVIVTAAVPVLAVLFAVNVTVDEAAGLPAKAAVTPFGNPVATRATFPENPFTGVIVIVLATLPTPCVIVTALGVAASVKC